MRQILLCFVCFPPWLCPSCYLFSSCFSLLSLFLFLFFSACVSVLPWLVSLLVSLHYPLSVYFSLTACVCLPVCLSVYCIYLFIFLYVSHLSFFIILSLFLPAYFLSASSCLCLLGCWFHLITLLSTSDLLFLSAHLSDSVSSSSLTLFISTSFFLTLHPRHSSLFCHRPSSACLSFRLWCLCYLNVFAARLVSRKLWEAKCSYSQWQDEPYKSTELIDVMYDTLRDCFGKEAVSYCKDTALYCMCVCQL